MYVIKVPVASVEGWSLQIYCNNACCNPERYVLQLNDESHFFLIKVPAGSMEGWRLHICSKVHAVTQKDIFLAASLWISSISHQSICRFSIGIYLTCTDIKSRRNTYNRWAGICKELKLIMIEDFDMLWAWTLTRLAW